MILVLHNRHNNSNKLTGHSEQWRPLHMLLTLFIFIAYNSSNNVVAQRPQFEFYKYNINEGLAVGTVVAKITPTIKDARYSFIEPYDENPWFVLTPDGRLLTNQVFDYEKLSEEQRKGGFSLHVSRHGHSNVIRISIAINDINDNRALFPVGEVLRNVPESLKPEDDIPFPNARDPDTRQEVTYSVTAGNTHDDFMVRRVVRDGVSRYVLALRENHFLDVETKEDNYTLVVSACEFISKKCSSLRVHITVDDVNDNSPIFDEDLPKNVEVPENASLAVPFFRVKATDADRGDNGKVEYSLFNNEHFRIDPMTGDIYAVTVSALDAEKHVLPSFLIIAKDKGTPVRKKTFFLIIKIIDCNDMVPKLTIHPASNRAASVVEGSPAGTVIGALTVIDDDREPQNNKIGKVTLDEGHDFFKLDRTENERLNGKTVIKYYIKSIKDIDHEVTPNIFISVSATDTGTPALTGRVNYTIQVIDRNDNAPVFERSVYETQINESAEVGTRVIQVRAHDDDEGENGRVSYSIASKHDLRWFTIDQDTGIIRLAEYIDREQQQTDSVEIRIQAQDNGVNVALTTTAIVKVTVLDSNDNDPEFVEQNMVFSLKENNLLDASIGKFLVSFRYSFLVRFNR